MNDASAQLFAFALAASWCGFGLYGVMRTLGRSPRAHEMLRRFWRARLHTKAAVVAGLVAVVAVGGTKPGGTNDPLRGLRSPPGTVAVEPAFAPVEVRTNHVALIPESSSAVEVEEWRKHGSSSGGVWLDFEAPVFRLGTNPVSRAHVAASGVVSFDSMRRPPVGTLLPDGTGLPALAPLLAHLGMVPEANWTNAGAASRFWHDAAPGRGRVLTWEDALLDRQPGRRVSVQTELRPSGDFTYRYDFADALDPLATNLVIGAQVGTNGVNALAILGTNLLAETVWRVDGMRITNGVSIADLLCTNGVLRVPVRFAIEWKNTSGLDPNADTDGDGLTDWDEVFLHGTDPNHSDTDGDSLSDSAEVLVGSNPLDADEDGDGVPDGMSESDWASNILWFGNAPSGAVAISVTLNDPVCADSSASLVVDELCIPLRSPSTWTLGFVPGRFYPYRLVVSGTARPDLSLAPDNESPPSRASSRDLRSSAASASPGFPFWRKGGGGVFRGPSPGGSGDMAVPTLSLDWNDPGDGSHVMDASGEICLHGTNEAVFTPSLQPVGIAGSFSLDNLTERGTNLVLSVPVSGRTCAGSASLAPGDLEWGSLTAVVSVHRCDSEYSHPYCSICGHYQPDDLELAFRSPLTLKHDNQTTISIVHANAPGETHANGMIEIRYKNGNGEWWTLGTESSLAPWTARFPGVFEIRGRISANGSEWTTPVRELVVRYPSVDEICLDPDVIQRAELEWQATLTDCSADSGFSRERGYWIVLDTRTNRYGAEQPFQGPFVNPGERASVNNLGRPPDRWSDPSDTQAGIIVAVAGFHTHVPTMFWPTNIPGRPVGPSTDKDFKTVAIQQMPGLVFDYDPDPDFSALAQTNAIPTGWPTNAPARLYPLTPPERRPLQ